MTVPGTFIAYEDMRRLGTRGYSAPVRGIEAVYFILRA